MVFAPKMNGGTVRNSGPESIGTRVELAARLDVLRQQAGLTIRQVATTVDAPHGTVGGYLTGRHLPPASQTDLFVRILAACGITDPAEVSAWIAALVRVRRPLGRRPDLAPYRGLEPFQPEHAAWFFGREALTETLLSRLTEPGPLMVVGPSGAGKSSLLRAGLVPALPDCVLVTPGAHPLAVLPAEADDELVLVVDQFEEIFTLCTDDGERNAFVAALGELPGRVVVGMRADFYASALRHALLAKALQDGQIVVPPMTGEELRSAIVEPARKARIDIEDGLVELLLHEVGAADGALPLLSHALLATWDRGSRGRLTVEDFRASGGIAGAVRQTAEAVYTELSPGRRDAARRLFLRLVHVSEDTADTRRLVRATELAREHEDVLDRYVERRLITVTADTVAISHEKLVEAWPRLRAWLDADRAGLRTHRQLTESARAWQDSDRDPDTLYRGARLIAATEWSAEHHDLNTLEREFLDASTESAHAEHRAARRRTRRLQRLLAALAVLSLLAGTLAVIAVEQAGRADAERDLAVSRQVAITADRLRETDPALAAQLSLAAYRIAPTVEARSSLIATSGAPMVTRMIRPGRARQAVAVSPDGRLLAAAGASEAAASDTAILLWDMRNPQAPRRVGAPVAGHTAPVYAVAFSPDGRLLATGGTDGTVRLWNVTDPARVRATGGPLTGSPKATLALKFSPNGTVLAGGGDDGVHLWRLTDASTAVPLGTPLAADGPVQSVAFHPAGGILAAADTEGATRLWDLREPLRPTSTVLTGPGGSRVNVATFSPDGAVLAVGANDRTVRLWQIGDPAAPVPLGAPLAAGAGWVNDIAFSADSALLAVGDAASTVRLWDWQSRSVLATLPHPEPVTAVAFRWDDNLLLTNSADGIARVWTVPGPKVPAEDRRITAVSFHPGGQLLASGGDDVRLAELPRRDRDRLTAVGPVLSAEQDKMGGPVAVSPDGNTLAAGTRTDHSVLLWDITDPRAPVPAGPPRTGPAELIEFIVFSPDGRLLAAGADDGTVRLWDITGDQTTPAATVDAGGGKVYEVAFSTDGGTLAAATSDGTVTLWHLDDHRPRQVGDPVTVAADTVYAIAFSPDGRTLAVGSADGAVRLWDVTDRARPRRISEPVTGLDGYVHTVAFSPDGRLLAAGKKGQLWLWNVTKPVQPELQATLNRPGQSTWHLAFSPDGHTLAGAAVDLRLWDTDPDRVARQICATAGDPVNETEWRRHLPDIAYQPVCQQ